MLKEVSKHELDAPRGLQKMRRNNKPQVKDELRTRAEKSLASKELSENRACDSTTSLEHELRVHQLELEMQNEELRRAQVELEESRTRYVDLYDFAPVGYLTLDDHGVILEANLTAARQLGIDRAFLINRPIHLFSRQDGDRIREHLGAVFRTQERQVCEVLLTAKSGPEIYARLESIFIAENSGAKRCRTNVIDITLTKQAEDAVRKS